jgi:hypothetical protein
VVASIVRIFLYCYCSTGGGEGGSTPWRCWLRHCATSRKVAGSIPDGVRLHSGPGVDSVSNRNEYQDCFLEGKGGRCGGLTTSPLSCADCLEILGAPASWNREGLSRPVRDSFTFIAAPRVLCDPRYCRWWPCVYLVARNMLSLKHVVTLFMQFSVKCSGTLLPPVAHHREKDIVAAQRKMTKSSLQCSVQR